MDSNLLIKNVKVSNSRPRGGPSIWTVDELNSKKKLITKLNHDCLAKVLMHVPVLERLEMENVCQKWKEACELSWYNVKRLNFDDLMITLDKKEKVLEIIMSRCARYLRYLTINDDHDNQYPWMSNVLKENCRNIIHFSINMEITINNEWKISDKDLIEIIDSMKKLKYLKVKINKNQSRDLAHKIVDKLPEDIQEIHLINAGKYGYRFYQITPLVERFKNLHCLSLNKLILTTETLKGILQNKNTLVKLCLSGCKFPTNSMPIFSNLKNLEHLNLSLVYDFNLNEILSIAHNCSKLKYFKFGNVIDATIYSTNKIPLNIYRELKYLNYLEYLKINNKIDISGYEDKNIISGIANNWKQLKYLNVWHGWQFSKTDLEEISKLNQLEYLKLQSAEVDSESFVSIANNCPELRVFGINMNNNLSETDFSELSKLKKLEKLDYYHYGQCYDNITDNLLAIVANNCKNLVDIRLEFCKNVTEVSLIQVGKLQNLKILDISNIKNVPNAMFDHFRKLEDLSCLNCPTVTDEGIIKILDNCQKLSCLNVKQTGITFKSLVHASQRKFVFKKLFISVDKAVDKKWRENNFRSLPYLRINECRDMEINEFLNRFHEILQR